MSLLAVIKQAVVRILYPTKNPAKKYYQRVRRYSFSNYCCRNEYQYEALITKLYHAVEKGLSYENYRAGFGRNNIDQLICLLEQYSEQYDVSVFFYQTALSTLKEYVKKNREYGHEDVELEARIDALKGEANTCGGVMEFEPYQHAVGTFDFAEFAKSRHSIRHFSTSPVDVDKVIDAIKLAQHTPSACNRQGWKTRIVCNPNLLKLILSNQNGNRGFGEEIHMLLVVTGDLRYFSKGREVHQVFVDGGMYAMNILHSLHHKGLATIPLSAALNDCQDKNVRKALNIDDAEVLIMFIGVGNYPTKCVTTKSSRKPSEVTVLK